METRLSSVKSGDCYAGEFRGNWSSSSERTTDIFPRKRFREKEGDQKVKRVKKQATEWEILQHNPGLVPE